MSRQAEERLPAQGGVGTREPLSAWPAGLAEARGGRTGSGESEAAGEGLEEKGDANEGCRRGSPGAGGGTTLGRRGTAPLMPPVAAAAAAAVAEMKAVVPPPPPRSPPGGTMLSAPLYELRCRRAPDATG